MADVSELVAAWNKRMEDIPLHEIKEMSAAEYELFVVEEILDVVGEDAELALAVFQHEDSEHGGYLGDAEAKLQKLVDSINLGH